MRTLVGHAIVQSAEFSPDGKSIASVGDRTARLWNAESGQQGGVLRTDKPIVASYPSFTPDGQLMLVTNDEGEGMAQLWEPARGTPIRSWQGRGDDPAGGREIATALSDGTIEIRETSAGQMLRHFPTIPGGCHALFYSADGQWIVTNGVIWARRTERSFAQVWDAQSGRLVQTIEGHPGWVSAVRFPRQPLDGDGWLRCDRETLGHPGLVAGTVFPGARRCDRLAGPQPRRPASGHRELGWDGGHLGYRDRPATASDARAFGLCSAGGVQPRRPAVVSGGHDGITRLWDVKSGQEVLALAGHTFWVYGVAFRPDGNLLVSTSSDGVRAWDASPVEPDR